MDMQQIFKYGGVTDGNLSYDSPPYSTTPVISEWMVEQAKFNLRSSPISPLSSHCDSDTFPAQSHSQEQYSSPENLSGTSRSCNSSLETNSSFHQHSPSSVHFRNSQQLFSSENSVLRDASGQNMRHALREIETALMGPDMDEDDVTTRSGGSEGSKRPENLSPNSMQPHQGTNVIRPLPSVTSKNQKQSQGFKTEKRLRATEASFHENPQGDLKKLLIECARAISENRMGDFEQLIQDARSVVSVSGEPIQRLGAYLIEGLVARKEASGTVIYRALKCREVPESKDLLSYMHILYEICPYLKFGYMAANGAIAEAFRTEDRVHIIDFQIAQGTQWMTLLQALAARPSGPPHVRITGIDDPVSKYARGASLELVGKRLAALSEKFKIPVEFHAVPVFAHDIKREMLDVRPGEALAVNFPLQLHHTPDESVDVSNPRDGLLRMVKSLSPKVVTLIEQESNTNTTPFLMRFVEALEFYSAMFESIDVTLPRDKKERINVEQHCLARDIVNIIACEGKERVERHELLGKWKSRFTMAGFRPFPLSSHVNSVIRSLLGLYSENYTLVEKDGAMLLGWKNRNLVSASAWC